MEPDETLITQMLVWARDIGSGRRRSPTPTEFPNYSEDEIRFHAVLLDQQGWLSTAHAPISTVGSIYPSVGATGLTAEGQRELRSRLED